MRTGTGENGSAVLRRRWSPGVLVRDGGCDKQHASPSPHQTLKRPSWEVGLDPRRAEGPSHLIPYSRPTEMLKVGKGPGGEAVEPG
jgi:hypothetical protein